MENSIELNFLYKFASILRSRLIQVLIYKLKTRESFSVKEDISNLKQTDKEQRQNAR